MGGVFWSNGNPAEAVPTGDAIPMEAVGWPKSGPLGVIPMGDAIPTPIPTPMRGVFCPYGFPVGLTIARPLGGVSTRCVGKPTGWRIGLRLAEDDGGTMYAAWTTAIAETKATAERRRVALWINMLQQTW